MIKNKQKYLLPIICALICLLLGSLSGVVSNAGDRSWYNQLVKPSFNPPAWVFGPVWSILYCLMGVALASIIRMKKKRLILLTLFTAQMILNLIWSPLFFRWHLLNWALADILALWSILTILVYQARSHKRIFIFLLPYLLWVSYASTLMIALWRLNT